MKFSFTQFSTDNTGHNEEGPEQLEVGDISPQDEIVKADCDDCSEAAEDDPDGRWNQDESRQVDVVIDGVDDRGEEELERSSD